MELVGAGAPCDLGKRNNSTYRERSFRNLFLLCICHETCAALSTKFALKLTTTRTEEAAKAKGSVSARKINRGGPKTSFVKTFRDRIKAAVRKHLGSEIRTSHLKFKWPIKRYPGVGGRGSYLPHSRRVTSLPLWCVTADPSQPSILNYAARLSIKFN